MKNKILYLYILFTLFLAADILGFADEFTPAPVENSAKEIWFQQEQQREARIKQEQIILEEKQHRKELESRVLERQSQLRLEHEALRKQLENGVETLYQEALSFYKQGDYAQAADRFKDVQDIFPAYKRSKQYMDEARLKSPNVK